MTTTWDVLAMNGQTGEANLLGSDSEGTRGGSLISSLFFHRDNAPRSVSIPALSCSLCVSTSSRLDVFCFLHRYQSVPQKTANAIGLSSVSMFRPMPSPPKAIYFTKFDK